MPHLIVWFLCTASALGAASAPASSPATQRAGLAQSVPPDTRIFLELRDIDPVLQARSGMALASMLRPLLTSAEAAQTRPAQTQPIGASSLPSSHPASRAASQPVAGTQPASAPSAWRARIARAIGLPNQTAADLLLSGRMAFASDGWDDLGDAVLLAEPRDPVALETQLGATRVPASNGKKVRLYPLGQDHELACDGHFALVGRKVNPAGLYRRTLTLWGNDAGVSLGDVAEFRERVGALPQGAQILLYASANTRGPATRPSAGDWWPLGWSVLRSTAVAVTVTPGGVSIETSARLTRAYPQTQPAGSSVELLARLPASALVAWTQQIQYAPGFRQLDQANPTGLVRFYIDVLQAGLPRGAFDRDVLSHLVGETVFVVGQTRIPTSTAPAAPVLTLPTLALQVRTDSPAVLEAALLHISANLLRLLNLQKLPEGPLRLKEAPLGTGEGVVRSIDVGRLLAPRSGCEFLRSLELSWAVADGWVLIGTHAEAVRQLVRTRRGGPDSMPAGPARETMAQVQQGGPAPMVLLVAQPRAAGDMIASWIAYLARFHPEILKAQWWQALRQRQVESPVRLGILSGRASDGGIEVAQTVAGWPAHGRLQPGDVLLALDGQILGRTDPEDDLRRLLAARARPERVVLSVRRAGADQQIEIPMPVAATRPATQIQPLEILSEIADVLRSFSWAGYALRQISPDVIHARLDLRLAG